MSSFLVTLTFLLSAPALACPIPVFQYSLEQWESDPYQLIVHHNGPMSEAEQALVGRLRAFQAGEGGNKANIVVGFRDYSLPEHPPEPARDLPYLEVRYPAITDARGALLTLPLEEGTLEQLLDSPARRTIGSMLLERRAAVWILLESGDPLRDRQAWRMLESETSRLERTLRVPEPDPQWGIAADHIHSEIKFERLRLRRDDPAEQSFIQMLLGTEPDLSRFGAEPMVFIIYGRGLVMYALIGPGINPRTLTAAGEFLTGPCSCQVKSGNPGTDLLMSVDWERKVERRFDVPVAPPAAVGGFFDRQEEAERRLGE